MVMDAGQAGVNNKVAGLAIKAAVQRNNQTLTLELNIHN